jgi:hypothetical protein
VEFDIAGTFMNPERFRPIGAESVRCLVDGAEVGLDFILNTLESFGIQGVFFIEVLNTYYFGASPMGDIAKEISRRGHDLGLHLHPVWMLFLDANWIEVAKRQSIDAKVYDSMSALQFQEAREVFQRGLDVFALWGLPQPSAVRVGGLMVGREVYRAMADLGLPLASHVGYAIYRPKETFLHLYTGRHWVDGVMEIPVTSYIDLGWGRLAHWKLLTVTGAGTLETRSVIRSVGRAGTNPVVILTHSGEYFYRASNKRGEARINNLTRRRLTDLCSYLCEHADRFSVTTFREQSDAWRLEGETPNSRIRVTPWAALRRLYENQVSNILTRRLDRRNRQVTRHIDSADENQSIGNGR